MHTRVLVAFPLAFVVASATPVHATASFTGLGFVPSLAGSSSLVVSADGSTVVGRSGIDAVRWTAAGGLVPLARPPGVTGARAHDVSGDGAVIVGVMTGSVTEAFRWTAAGGMEAIGGYRALGVSRDGAVVVGEGPVLSGSQAPYLRSEAFRWTADGGMEGLGGFTGFPPEFPSAMQATGVSADGSLVIGYTHNVFDEWWLGFRWTAADGMEHGPGGITNGVSSDGARIVGEFENGQYSGAPRPNEAFFWTAEGGQEALGFLHPLHPDDSFDNDSRTSGANAVSDAGRVVGVSCPSQWEPGPCEAFLWDELDGMRGLGDLLEDEHGLDLTGWTLRSATDITPDGRTIVGFGTNPSGATEGWIAFLPEPGAAGLLVLGFAALASRGRPLTPRRSSPRARAASSPAGA